MKTKAFYAVAASALMLASCANEDVVSPNAALQDGEAVMGFSMKTNNLTRDDALQTVNKDFGVWAIKGDSKADIPSTNVENDVNLVMKNYLVGYNDGVAYEAPAEQNLFGSQWFYENLGYEDGVSENSNNKNQYLKYWDEGKTYTYFFAYSPYVKSEVVGEVTITTPTFSSNYASGKPALAFQTPISYSSNVDDVPMYATRRETNADHIGTTAKVPMEFHHLFSKVKIAIYEEVSGYYVELQPVVFGTENGIFAYSAKLNGTTCESGNIAVSGRPVILFRDCDYDFDNFDDAVTYVYPNVTTARFKFDLPDKTGGKQYLPEDRADRYYSATEYNVLPYNNNDGLQFVFNFDLVGEDTGELIHVKNARSFVGPDYTKWLPNKVYTYVFRITKDASGNTKGTDPNDEVENPGKGLYPIVFDNLTVEDWSTEVEYPSTSTDFPVSK